MLGTNFSPWPCFTNEEITAVENVLRSNRVNYWTGNEGRQFEKEFAKYTDSKYAIALANGTLALDAALHALKIGEGDEVIVTSRTFLASVSSIINCGAIPVFADIDLDSQNITPDSIRLVLTPKTRAIMCVHLAGWPCDMDPIMEIARDHDLKVIEDCAQAHGARYKGRSVGSIGDIGAWSFCQDKIMTTGGEGGMVTTNDHELWSSMWSYKDHGKSWDAVYNREHPPGFRWLHETFGSNFRLTEMQSAIGRIQTARMPVWHEIRSRYAMRLAETCHQFPDLLRCPLPSSDIEHAWYKFYCFIRPGGLKTGWHRDRVMNDINSMGVPCFSGSCSEVYLEKAFDETGFRPSERLSNALELGETSLMFMVHPTLTESEIDKACEVMNQVFNKAVR